MSGEGHEDETGTEIVPGSAETAVSLADQAVRGLGEALEARRRQADAVIAVIGDLREQRAVLTADLTRTREDLRQSRDAEERLRQKHMVLLTNHKRLYTGFERLLKSVEDARNMEVGIDQRIEAALLASDIGIGIGEPVDVTPERVPAFIAAQSAPVHGAD